MARKRPILNGSVVHTALLGVTEQLSIASDTRGDKDTDALVAARLKARKGDCEDLLALLWPTLIIEGKDAERLGRGVRLDSFQVDLINSMLAPDVSIYDDDREVATWEVMVKGCTGAGKGCAIAMGVALWYYIHNDGCCVLTSASFEHVKKVLWAEVRRWIRASVIEFPGNLLKEAMDGGEKRYIKLANPETDEGFSGHHSTHVLFAFDEATGTGGARYLLAKTQAHCICAAANPRSLSGWFRKAFPKVKPDVTQTVDGDFGPRRLISVDGARCANVIHGDAMLIPGQIEKSRWVSLKRNPDPRWVDVFAHGRFPVEDPEKQIILASDIMRAQEAFQEAQGASCFGLDLAANESDGDETILAAGGLHGCSALHATMKADTMQTVGWVISLAREIYGINLAMGQNPVAVDTDGLGKGVGDRLQELGVWVIFHTGNATSEVDSRRYMNLRAETYGELGRRLDIKGAWADTPFMLPPDSAMAEEMVAPEKIYTSDGFRFRITPKESRGKDITTLRDILGRSPDRADAVGYLYLAVRQIEAYREAVDVSRIVLACDPSEYKIRPEEITQAETDRMNSKTRDLLHWLHSRGEGYGYEDN